MKKNNFTFKDVSYFGSGRLQVKKGIVKKIPKEEHEDYDIVSILDAKYIYNDIENDEAPTWWENILQQIDDISHSDGYAVIMKLPDDAYLIAGRYSESFYNWVKNKLPSDGVIYDRFARGVIIDNPEWQENTNQALSRHTIRTTKHAATYISPITERSKELEEYAKKAQKEGFEIPDKTLFPSSRTLMKHQEPVVISLAKRGQGILADDVGSGKSSMFINGFFSLAQYKIKHEGVNKNDVWPLVIVTKKSLVLPTKREVEVWLHGAHVHAVTGPKTYDIPDDAQVIVVPLTSLNKCYESIIDKNPQGVIYDESHMVKNLNAKRTKIALDLANHIRKNVDKPYIVCASATPMPNRPAELYSQLAITGMDKPIIEEAEKNQKFPARTKFSVKQPFSIKVNDNLKFDMRYCEGHPGFFGWDNNGSSHEEELSQLLYENGLIRRRKFEFITPLPLLHQKTVYCTLSEEDHAKYIRAEEKFKDHLVTMLREKSRKEQWTKQQLKEEIFEKLSKADSAEAIMKMTELRQLVGEMKIPSIVEWIHRFFAKDPSIVGKNPEKHKKLIVFAHHKEVQKQLIEHPDLQQYGVTYITAGTKDVNKAVDEFQDWNSGKNIIILYSGADAGLTLTSSYQTLITEIPWSPSTALQMAGRSWARISELYPPHEATLNFAVADVNIDMWLMDMLRSKSDIFKKVIDGESSIEAINVAESEEEDTEEINNTNDLFIKIMESQ